MLPRVKVMLQGQLTAEGEADGFEYVDLRQDQAERLTCPVCHEIMKDPTDVTACGHSFCEECISDWLLDNYACPTCRSDTGIKQKTRPSSYLVRSEIHDLKVKCTHCSWIGAVGEFKSKHTWTCKTKCKMNMEAKPGFCHYEGSRAEVKAHEKSCFWLSDEGRRHVEDVLDYQRESDDMAKVMEMARSAQSQRLDSLLEKNSELNSRLKTLEEEKTKLELDRSKLSSLLEKVDPQANQRAVPGDWVSLCRKANTKSQERFCW